MERYTIWTLHNLGCAAADMLTSYWNLKENLSKVLLLNRRVHHRAIGGLLSLSNLYKDNPILKIFYRYQNSDILQNSLICDISSKHKRIPMLVYTY